MHVRQSFLGFLFRFCVYFTQFFWCEQAYFVSFSILYCFSNAYSLFDVIYHSYAVNIPFSLYKRYTRILYIFIVPPPGFWILCRTLGNFAQKCLQAKHPCFRVHPETRVWHSFLSDVRKSMITPRRAGRRLFSVFGIRDRESLGIWVDFEFACDFACSGCV